MKPYRDEQMEKALTRIQRNDRAYRYILKAKRDLPMLKKSQVATPEQVDYYERLL